MLKYKVLLEAKQRLENKIANTDILLVIERKLPVKFKTICYDLGVNS